VEKFGSKLMRSPTAPPGTHFLSAVYALEKKKAPQMTMTPSKKADAAKIRNTPVDFPC